ncbi:hypothetical protein CWE12_06595 [Aliidiomarina sedimenti]|uniref:Uncharacterized protein n=1 Tax=Aliidiomarina sedimenti TaxID=1933879 RepID=A0ABY0C0G4_9GAMM|nr:hypothetical protein [Aliidiomarina sedimenti]RUO30901.1 hypothetical protein CWE12_06595 [Aliidiomarina sedimenti]
MRRSRSVFHLLYLIVIAVLLTLLYVERYEDTETTSDTDQQANVSATREDDYQAQHHALVDQLETLETTLLDQLSALQQQLTRLEDATGNRAPGSTETTEQTPAAGSPQQPVTVDTTMLDDFASHQQRFDIQSVDPDWAYRTRERIVELFADDPALKHYQLNDIECRTTLCQVDIRDRRPTNENNIEASLQNPEHLRQALDLVNNNDHGLHYLIRMDSNNGRYRVLLERTNVKNDD